MPFTANLNLEQPLRGSYVGVWDTPVNTNWGLIDSALGATVSVALSNIPVTLSATQYQCGLITFTGVLAADVVVTFPAVGRFYLLQNSCSGNTTFRVICRIGALANYVALPPNEVTMVQSDGTNMNFVGLGRIGTYWDFAGGAVPIWVSGSSPAPYLNCDGSVFASSTYPVLASYLGGTTLPDARGRFRASLNQGTGRIVTAIDGNTLLAGGGSVTITQANIPNYALSVVDPGHSHAYTLVQTAGLNNVEAGAALSLGIQAGVTSSATTGITVASGGSGTGYAPPGYIGGLTLIRAG